MVPGTNLRRVSRIASRVATRILTSIAAEDFCFAAGTHITTLRGEMPVEQIKKGDLVRTRSGAYSPVVEISSHEIDANHLKSFPELFPCVIRKNSVGDGLPRRDMKVTSGQEFDPSIRNKVQHAIRSTGRSSGNGRELAAGQSIEYVMFRLNDASAVRAERIWVEATPAANSLEREQTRPLLWRA